MVECHTEHLKSEIVVLWQYMWNSLGRLWFSFQVFLLLLCGVLVFFVFF